MTEIAGRRTVYYAWLWSMVEHMPAGDPAQPVCRAETLRRLIDAVVEEEADRVRCRDTDVRAATRVRPWTYSALQFRR